MNWPSRMILSLLVIVAAYPGGLIATRVVWRRLAALARRTDGSGRYGLARTEMVGP